MRPDHINIYRHEETGNVYIVCADIVTQAIVSSMAILTAIVKDLCSQKLSFNNVFVITHAIYTEKLFEAIDIESFQKV